MAASSWLLLVSLCLSSFVAAQTPNKKGDKEVHPKLPTWECTKKHGCVKKDTYIVLDSMAHPIHQKDDKTAGCGSWGGGPPEAVCPDVASCAKNCILEPVKDYSYYGLKTEGAALTMDLLRDDGSSASPRVYLLAENKKEYEMIKLTGKEFTFDTDISKLPCGMNGALYMSEMHKNGGTSKYNKAGAYYGAGYCDAQCYATPFVNGVGNIGGKGACCPELDIFEANRAAGAIAPHPCTGEGSFLCEGDDCGFNGVCDEWGCTYNPYKVGNPDFWAPGGTVDTSRPFTVITQFPADKDGKLKEIRRLHIQDGKIFEQPSVNITGPPEQNFMDDKYCSTVIGEGSFLKHGGMAGMGDAMTRGMVLAMSVWWDEGGAMQWLDGAVNNAGPCNATEGFPSAIRQIEPRPKVVFSNIKWGEIGSTFKVPKAPKPPVVHPKPPVKPPVRPPKGHGKGHGGRH